MQKTVAVAELGERFRAVFDEVTAHFNLWRHARERAASADGALAR